MQLSEQDAQLFFDLMWSLQHYVNQKRGIYPDVESVDQYRNLSRQEKAEVRQVLYSDISIIDTFVRDNPQELSEQDLAIVSSWKRFVEGEFFIERCLKKYAVFIKDEDVYGVLGLFDPIEEVVPTSLPAYGRTVLLPFKGKIIYDGMIAAYSMSFGGGIKEDLKETYMTAKQNRRIITTLDPEKRKKQQQERRALVKDYTAELEQLAEVAKKLRSSSAAPAIHSPAFKVVRESIKFARAAMDDPKDVGSLIDQFNKVNSALRRASRVIDRTEV